MMDFLEKYEFITSWILLPVEIVFLCLMLWEFKYIRMEQKEKRREESEKKVQIFDSCIAGFVGGFFEKYKGNNQLVKKFLDKDKNLITQICNDIHKKNHIPVNYSEFYIKYLIYSIKLFHEENGKENEPINSEEIASYCKGVSERLSYEFYGYNQTIKSGINHNIYEFFTDKQIDKVFENVTKEFEKFYKSQL